jgi:hypothetical protein
VVSASWQPSMVDVRKLRGRRTRAQCAAAVHVTARAWQAWELGTNRMPRGLYELALIRLAK